jgi:hypothetical protein
MIFLVVYVPPPPVLEKSNTSEGLTGIELKFINLFFRENRTFSPFLLSSCVAFLKLSLKSMTLPRKLYSSVSVKELFCNKKSGSVIHCHLMINFVMKRYTINFVNIV